MTKKLDLNKLATATGGTLVLASDVESWKTYVPHRSTKRGLEGKLNRSLRVPEGVKLSERQLKELAKDTKVSEKLRRRIMVVLRGHESKRKHATANNQKQVEVRMLDGYHTQQGTSQLKLPIVFKGTVDDIREWAKMNHYREVADRASLFGAYFTDRHENSYLLT